MVEIKIKQLEWCPVSNEAGGHIAGTPFNFSYCYWIDEKGITTYDPTRNHKIHESTSAAREYCQKDFESRVMECINSITQI